LSSNASLFSADSVFAQNIFPQKLQVTFSIWVFISKLFPQAGHVTVLISIKTFPVF